MGVIQLLVTPVLQPALPTGGGKGAFCDDLGVLVIDEVSDGGYVPVRHGRLLVLCYIVRLFLQAKSGLGGGRCPCLGGLSHLKNPADVPPCPLGSVCTKNVIEMLGQLR